MIAHEYLRLEVITPPISRQTKDCSIYLVDLQIHTDLRMHASLAILSTRDNRPITFYKLQMIDSFMNALKYRIRCQTKECIIHYKCILTRVIGVLSTLLVCRTSSKMCHAAHVCVLGTMAWHDGFWGPCPLTFGPRLP